VGGMEICVPCKRVFLKATFSLLSFVLLTPIHSSGPQSLSLPKTVAFFFHAHHSYYPEDGRSKFLGNVDNFYQTTRYDMPEDGSRQSHVRR
jgi:hypothetical protein